MKLFGVTHKFSDDEIGAVTADWVVLSAAVVILAIGTVVVLDIAVNDLMDEIATVVRNVL